MSLPEPEVPKRVSEVTPSRAFEMFRQGYSPMEVVEETDGDPIKIRDWYRAWLDMIKDWSRLKGEELERQAKECLAELKELLGADAVRLQGRKPSGLVSAMIYILAKKEGLSVSQVRLADSYGISEQVIRESRALLEQLMKDKGLNLITRHFVVVSQREG